MTYIRVVESKGNQMSNPYKVDDVLSSSWGYDQTNVDFYKVVAVKKSLIELRRLKSETKENGFMCGDTWPVQPFEFDERYPAVIRKKPKPDGSVKLESWGMWCRPWDGKPKHCSWYA
jgi:hypothetical protein